MDTNIQNVVIDRLRDTKCSFCRCWRYNTDFLSNDRIVKSCIKCRQNQKRNNDKRKEKNADKRKEKNTETETKENYYLKNREKLLAYQKNYIKDNPKYKQYQRNYYQNHKQRLIDLNKSYYQSNKEDYPLFTKFSFMVYSAKANDKKYEYDEVEYTDIPYLYELYTKQQGLCWYENCETKMDYTTFNRLTKKNNLITIQRLNDNLPHIKTNCVLACFNCNINLRRQMT